MTSPPKIMVGRVYGCIADFLPFMDLFLHILGTEGFDLKVDAAGLKGRSRGVRRRCVWLQDQQEVRRQSFLPSQCPQGLAEA